MEIQRIQILNSNGKESTFNAVGGNSVHKGPQIKNGARRHVE